MSDLGYPLDPISVDEKRNAMDNENQKSKKRQRGEKRRVGNRLTRIIDSDDEDNDCSVVRESKSPAPVNDPPFEKHRRSKRRKTQDPQSAERVDVINAEPVEPVQISERNGVEQNVSEDPNERPKKRGKVKSKLKKKEKSPDLIISPSEEDKKENETPVDNAEPDVFDSVEGEEQDRRKTKKRVRRQTKSKSDNNTDESQQDKPQKKVSAIWDQLRALQEDEDFEAGDQDYDGDKFVMSDYNSSDSDGVGRRRRKGDKKSKSKKKKLQGDPDDELGLFRKRSSLMMEFEDAIRNESRDKMTSANNNNNELIELDPLDNSNDDLQDDEWLTKMITGGLETEQDEEINPSALSQEAWHAVKKAKKQDKDKKNRKVTSTGDKNTEIPAAKNNNEKTFEIRLNGSPLPVNISVPADNKDKQTEEDSEPCEFKTNNTSNIHHSGAVKIDDDLFENDVDEPDDQSYSTSSSDEELDEQKLKQDLMARIDAFEKLRKEAELKMKEDHIRLQKIATVRLGFHLAPCPPMWTEVHAEDKNISLADRTSSQQQSQQQEMNESDICTLQVEHPIELAIGSASVSGSVLAKVIWGNKQAAVLGVGGADSQIITARACAVKEYSNFEHSACIKTCRDTIGEGQSADWASLITERLASLYPAETQALNSEVECTEDEIAEYTKMVSEFFPNISTNNIGLSESDGFFLQPVPSDIRSDSDSESDQDENENENLDEMISDTSSSQKDSDSNYESEMMTENINNDINCAQKEKRSSENYLIDDSPPVVLQSDLRTDRTPDMESAEEEKIREVSADCNSLKDDFKISSVSTFCNDVPIVQSLNSCSSSEVLSSNTDNRNDIIPDENKSVVNNSGNMSEANELHKVDCMIEGTLFSTSVSRGSQDQMISSVGSDTSECKNGPESQNVKTAFQDLINEVKSNSNISTDQYIDWRLKKKKQPTILDFCLPGKKKINNNTEETPNVGGIKNLIVEDKLNSECARETEKNFEIKSATEEYAGSLLPSTEEEFKFKKIKVKICRSEMMQDMTIPTDDEISDNKLTEERKVRKMAKLLADTEIGSDAEDDNDKNNKNKNNNDDEEPEIIIPETADHVDLENTSYERVVQAESKNIRTAKRKEKKMATVQLLKQFNYLDEAAEVEGDDEEAEEDENELDSNMEELAGFVSTTLFEDESSSATRDVQTLRMEQRRLEDEERYQKLFTMEGVSSRQKEMRDMYGDVLNISADVGETRREILRAKNRRDTVDKDDEEYLEAEAEDDEDGFDSEPDQNENSEEENESETEEETLNGDNFKDFDKIRLKNKQFLKNGRKSSVGIFKPRGDVEIIATTNPDEITAVPDFGLASLSEMSSKNDGFHLRPFGSTQTGKRHGRRLAFVLPSISETSQLVTENSASFSRGAKSQSSGTGSLSFSVVSEIGEVCGEDSGSIISGGRTQNDEARIAKMCADQLLALELAMNGVECMNDENQNVDYNV